jgi:peptide/nickel transport system ATP-binding protein
MALLMAERLYKTFCPSKGIYAVSNVGFSLNKGECIGVAGESGSGKSTLVRMIARLIDLSPNPQDGELGLLRLRGQTISLHSPAGFASSPLRADIQMVFQDPTSSLNPCFSAFRSIADPLYALCRMRRKAAIRDRVFELADMVHLPRDLLDRLPHQLSGGQKARVGIARALAPNPAVLLLDEPTTALDVSVQGQILALLDDLRYSLGLSMIFVSHDLSVLRLLCDRILIMLRGEMVEYAPTEKIFSSPSSPYTRTLLEAMPVLQRRARE